MRRGSTSRHRRIYVFDRGGQGTIQTRWVKRVAYERLDNGGWRLRPAFDPTQVVDPFGPLTERGAAKYDSTKKIDGKTVYVLVVDGGRLLDLTTIPAYNLTDEGVTSATWTLVVDADGHPISGSWMLRGKGRVSGQLQELLVELDVTFSKVGAKITISSP
jgi:hypothetical protein